jgi:hypothetical protein
MRYFIFFLVFFFQNSAFSQSENDKIIFLDSLKAKTNSENYFYKKIIQDHNIKQSQYKITFFNKKNVLVQQGYSLDKDVEKYEGILTYYNDSTGSISAKYTYLDGLLLGKYEIWYENGNKKEEGEYFKDNFGQNPEQRIDRFLDKNQRSIVMNGNGYYSNDTYNFQLEGNVTNGFKDGIWKGINRIKQYVFKEKHKKGIFKSGVSIDKTGKKHKYSQLNESGLRSYNFFRISELLKRKTKYAKEAKLRKVERIVYTQIFVNEKGSIIKLEMLQELDYGLEEQIKAILLKHLKFKPNKQRGISNNCIYRLPVKIDSQN